MTKKLYGIRVPLAVDDYVWVCGKPDPETFIAEPILFEDIDQAYDHADTWGPMAYVKEYFVDESTETV